MISESEQQRRIREHNAIRKQAAGKELLERAKASRAQTNRAFAELSEGLKKAENTLQAIADPVGKFLSEHCGFKTGDPLPMWDELYEALCRSLPQNGYTPERDDA